MEALNVLETHFMDELFRNVENSLSTENRMLGYPVSIIYTATSVLMEFMDRFKIGYHQYEIEKMCKGFSSMPKNNIVLSHKSDDGLLEILFGLLSEGSDFESKKKSGSERTPDEIIDYMLDIVGYHGTEIINKAIIDPACGTGTFIAKMTQRFLKALEGEKNIDVVKEKLLRKELIKAFDTKPCNVYVTKIVLISILIRNHVIREVKDIIEMLHHLPILCRDFLKVTAKADYVVGNPPYIRIQNLPDQYRKFMKENYVSATGRFDIYACFIENSDKILAKNGKMCLITSDKYLTANYGIGIRRYLCQKGHVRKIVDLFDTKFFGAAVLPAIILCENSTSINDNIEYIGIKRTSKKQRYDCLTGKDFFEYIEREEPKNKIIVRCGTGEGELFEVSRSVVKLPVEGGTWNFSSVSENDIKSKIDAKRYCTVQDIFDVCVGIKTTADAVFVKPMTEEFIKERGLEQEVIYPLIQSFDICKWAVSWGDNSKDRYILYPHREKQGNMFAIPLDDIPNAKKYLEECSDILKKRTYLTESKTREWYECWVPQKLSRFRQPKIVTRDIVSHNSFAYDDSGKLCQGNTFFLTCKQSVFARQYSSMTEKQYHLFALGMLNSKVMEYYQKMISGCLYSQKYRYTTTNMNKWPIPKIAFTEAVTIAELVDRLLCGQGSQDCIEEQIDDIMYEQFELGKDDISKIEKFIGIGK